MGSTWRRSSTSLTDRISTLLANESYYVLICVNTASPVATGRETFRQLADKRLTAWQLPYLIFFNICSVCSLSFLNKGAKTDKLQNFQAGLLLQSLQWRCLVTETVAAELKSLPRADLGPSLGQNGCRH